MRSNDLHRHQNIQLSLISNVVPACLVILAFLAVCAALYFCSRLLIPFVFALLAYLTLRPLVGGICRLGASKTIASGLVVLTLVAIFGMTVWLLSSPVQQWLETAPNSVATIRKNLEGWRKPLTAIDQAGEELSKATENVAAGQAPVEVSVRKPRMIDEAVLVNTTGQVLALCAAIAVLTFFMLSTGDDLVNRILYVLPDDEKRIAMLEVIGRIQDTVGRYLGQIACINFCLGVVVTGMMWLLNMPTPMLWGILAMLFNFIPYIGALAATTLVFLAAISTFDSASRAALTAVAFWSCTAIEGQFITPTILGRTLRSGPVIVLSSVAFWGFFWGLPGVLIAIPLLIVQRYVYAQFESTYPLAIILGEEVSAPTSSRKQLDLDSQLVTAPNDSQ
jgi:predicted PurR-regulated permease PerM